MPTVQIVAVAAVLVPVVLNQRSNMRHLLLLGSIAIGGCSSSHTVTQYGGIRDALQMGNTQAQVTFEEVQSKQHAYAVGALPNLDGEITIFNGTIYTATTQDGNTATTELADETFDAATLLTATHVEEWVTTDLPSNHPIEEAIELMAIIMGIDTETPFPFLISGTTKNYHLHVINGYCPVTNPDLNSQFQPWRLDSSNSEDITVVGFYAKNQEGVMTHHGSNVHIHGIMEINGVLTSGHLDSVELNDGAILFLPTE